MKFLLIILFGIIFTPNIWANEYINNYSKLQSFYEHKNYDSILIKSYHLLDEFPSDEDSSYINILEISGKAFIKINNNDSNVNYFYKIVDRYNSPTFCSNNQLLLAEAYDVIRATYYGVNKIDSALVYTSKGKNILEKLLVENQSDSLSTAYMELKNKYSISLISFGLYNFLHRQYKKAEEAFLTSIKYHQAHIDSNNENYITAYMYLTYSYSRQKKYKKVIETALLTEILINQAKEFKDKEINLITIANLVGLAYSEIGNYIKAMQYYKLINDAVSEFEDQENQTHIYYTLYNNIAIAEKRQGRFYKAIDYYNKSLDLIDIKNKKTYDSYLMISTNLASLYSVLGNYDKADSISNFVYHSYLNRLEPDKTHIDSVGLYVKMDNERLINTLYSIINTNIHKRNFVKAIDYSLKAIEILQKDSSINQSAYILIYAALAHTYTIIGNYEKATHYYAIADDINNNNELPTNHRIGFLMNFASFYLKTNQLDKSEIYYIKAFNQIKENMGSKHYLYAKSILFLGSIYIEKKEYKKAYGYLTRVDSIMNSSKKITYKLQANVYKEFSNYYYKINKLEDAIKYMKKAVAVNTNKDDDLYLYKTKLILYLFENSQSDEAITLLAKHVSNFNKDFLNKTFSINDREKHYLTSIMNDHADLYLSNFYRKNIDKEKLSKIAYDDLLNRKGFSLFSSNSIKNSISNEDSSNKDYKTIIDEISRLSVYEKYSSDKISELNINLDSLKEIKENLEIKLNKNSSTFSYDYYTRKDLQKVLNKNQAVIEIVRFNYISKKDSANNICYAALALTSQSKSPHLILINQPGDAFISKFEKKWKNEPYLYAKEIYESLWQPIAKYLKQNNIKEVYIAPDGAYHTINIDALQNPKTNKYVFQENNINIISAARELLTGKTIHNNNKEIVLFGNPEFYSKLDHNNTIAGKYRNFDSLNSKNSNLRTLRNGLNSLPESEKEINQIAHLMKDKYSINLFSKVQASEEQFKKLNQPNILHIATHGFYIGNDSTKINDNSLLNSGLVMAGAGTFLDLIDSKNKFDYKEDGLLTAYEVSNQTLNSRLVVLSACESGLGDVLDGEGIYGLQRAFKIAGVENLIVSLWEVEDIIAYKFMTSFYEELSKSDDIRLSYRKARNTIQKTYPNPFHWGAFVLINSSR